MARREDAPARRVKLTYDDYVHFPDDGLRHELIDGVHYVSPSPVLRHQRILGRLYLSLGNWLANHPAGEAFFAPFDVVFTEFDVVVPDLIFVSNARAALLNEKNATGADLVIEIGSPGTRRRDETIKLRLYEREGVSEYWFVDPKHDVVRVYRRHGGAFEAPIEHVAAREDVLITALLPGWQQSVHALFSE